MITYLELDILECNVKWALGSITTNKTSGGDGIADALFKILKDNTVKVLYSICQQIWKTQQWLQDWETSVFIPIQKKGNAKECSNCCTVALTSRVNIEMLKILQASTGTENFRMFKMVLRKGRGIRDQIANILWIMEKVR